jgi:hypothetical protein
MWKERPLNPYRDLEAAYQQIARRPAHRTILRHVGDDLDSIVATIRGDTPLCGPSDHMIRSLIVAGRITTDAIMVVLYALAPELRSRLSHAATLEYHTDALGELTFVILDSNLDRPRLAHRLVNRAHNRAWRTALRVRACGALDGTAEASCPPSQLIDSPGARVAKGADLVDIVADRVDLARFRAAVERAVDAGQISPAIWAAYRNHRLRPSVTTTRARNSRERAAAHRAGRRLAPYIHAYLGIGPA